MSGYEYGNARLRAMRSRLLTRQEIIQLSGSSSLPDMMGGLVKTPYRKSLELALIQSTMLDSLFDALHYDFVETASKIRNFYEGTERTLVDLILSSYDVHNIKTMLRGIAHQSPRSEIEGILLPVGVMSETVIDELFRASSIREAVDILATIGHMFAQPLLILRAEHPGADLIEMEIALDRWRFQEATRTLKNDQDEARPLLNALRLEADISNLLMALRFVGSPSEQQQLKTRLQKRGLSSLFSGFGTITPEQLSHIYQAKTIKSSLDVLMNTPYAPALQEGLKAYDQSNRLSEVEKALRRYQLHWLVWQIAKDPLGIGAVLGYLALKTNEISNLRRTARGLQLKLKPETIQADLEFVE